jgi:hypothetical protein
MTKKNITDMVIKPICLYLTIAVIAFGIHFTTRNDKVEMDSGQQSFERFVENVQSGKQQLTTERALEIMRTKQVAVDSYLKAFVVEGWLIQYIGWISLLGIGMQVFVMFRVRKRLNKSADSRLKIS